MNLRTLTLVLAAVLVLAVATIPSFAQNGSVMNVHVNKAVVIPNHVLEPGDYVFRLRDSSSRPIHVAVMSADGKTFYGVLPVYAATRNSGGDSEIAITARDGAGFARIDSWYFPASQDGFRFIYSRSNTPKAVMTAQNTK